MAGDGSQDVRARWDANAEFWDERMGEQGNAFHLTLVRPAVERLMGTVDGRRVLEIACGNGLFARRLAGRGARVTATDFSPPMLERAAARGGMAIDYRELDATDPQALRALADGGPFDAVVCNMALMDIERLDPLADALPALLADGAPFVFATCHPAFNRLGMRFVAEQEERAGEVVARRGVFVDSYLSSRRGEGVAILGQPVTQLYFDRSLSALLGPFLRAGLVLDGLEEPAFPAPGEAAALDWSGVPDLPPVLVGRLRAGTA
jgi:2-polyprenyl-3-methyl-5-hydroxy-6-metoxy-1,4-benzoquinol methylase